MNKRLEPWVVFGIGAVAAGLGAWLYAWLIFTLSNSLEAWCVIAADLLLKVVIPAAGGFVALAWRRRARRSDGEPRAGLKGRLGRWIAALVLAAYRVTWAFGVPSVITSLTGQEIQEYKQAAAYWQALSSEPYPRIKTLAAFPLLPGLLVVYHDSQTGGQSGWGGWVFYAWWGTGSRRIGTLWRRFS